MISDDELHDGMIFILQLRNSAGVAFQWMETLKDQIARRWYDIYRKSDWGALKAEAAGVFCHPVTETQRSDFLKNGSRCISINTSVVKVEDIQGHTVTEQTKG
jgi:hypothetical protein